MFVKEYFVKITVLNTGMLQFVACKQVSVNRTISFSVKMQQSQDSKPIKSHHQPINVPTAGAQAFLMDHPQ
jgi:hypothetical protein